MAHFFEEELEYMKSKGEKKPIGKFSHKLGKYMYKEGLS